MGVTRHVQCHTQLPLCRDSSCTSFAAPIHALGVPHDEYSRVEQPICTDLRWAGASEP
jgi:hypothetical protein